MIEGGSVKDAIPSSPLSASSTNQLSETSNSLNDGDRSKESDPHEGARFHSITRRRLIGAIGAVGLGAALGTRVLDASSAASASSLAAAAPSPSKKPLPQWMMVLDLRNCDGCKACTAACQFYHYLPKETEWIKVYDMVGSDGQTYYLPRLCQMCEDPPCQAVCPVGATFRTDEGLVLIDQNACIGCRTCMAACPFESRYFNTSVAPKVPRQPFPTTPEWPVPQRLDTVGKCVWCAARLPQGMLPECVTACPMGVIYMGDLTTNVAVNGRGDVIQISEFLQENDAVRLKEELGTNPRVYYIPGHGQDVNA